MTAKGLFRQQQYIKHSGGKDSRTGDEVLVETEVHSLEGEEE